MHKNNIGRLDEVLTQIDDPHIKEIVRGVFKVEISYRSSDRTNFPWQRIREVVEDKARIIESEEKPQS